MPIFHKTIHSYTHKGGREINEDSFFVSENGDRLCAVVADGLGGHGKGEIASAITTETFKGAFDSNGPDSMETGLFLESAFNLAQANVMEAQQVSNAAMDFKTTCAALYINEDLCRWGHIGDTRVYFYRNNKLTAKTRDHSVPQMLVAAKEIKERDIPGHPDRNRLLRVIGAEWGQHNFDLSDEYEITGGCAFLLCTDGYWEHLTEKIIKYYLKRTDSAKEWIEMLTSEVISNGSAGDMDNYTAVAVRF